MNKQLFSESDIPDNIKKAVAEMGYDHMTDIQALTIPLIIEGNDVLGRSATGTGKTAAFGIPAIMKAVASTTKGAKVLILCPTRELAMQVTDEIRKYAKYTEAVPIATVFGGQSMDIQIRALKIAKIVVGTPGRIMDHMRRKTLKLGEISLVVLDEADEMLNMGFCDDIRTILTEAPLLRQTVLFSATMPSEILKITKEFQTDPTTVEVERTLESLPQIEQLYYKVPQSHKLETLIYLLKTYTPKQALVFCNTKRMVDEIVQHLDASGIRCAGLHGDMKQVQRTMVMRGFKAGIYKLLVATDVAARGIDVSGIEAVFNFDLPQDDEYYLHRIGRTGRAGRKGVSYSFASNRGEERKMRELERYTGSVIKHKTIADTEEETKSNNPLVAKLQTKLEKGGYDEWNDFTDIMVEQGYDYKQIASALAAIAFDKSKTVVPTFERDMPAERPLSIGRAGGVRSSRPAGKGGEICVRVNIGRADKVAPNHLVGAITEETGLSSSGIGKIDIFESYTNIYMGKEDAEVVLGTMEGAKIKGKTVSFTASETKEKQEGSSAGAKFGNFQKRKKTYGSARGTEKKKVIKISK